MPVALALLLLLDLLLLDALGLLGASVRVLLQPELLGLGERTDVCGCGGAEGDRASDAGGEEHVVCYFDGGRLGEVLYSESVKCPCVLRRSMKLTVLLCLGKVLSI